MDPKSFQEGIFNKLDKELARAELLDRIGCLVQEAIEVHKVSTDELKDLISDVYFGQYDVQLNTNEGDN